ncbi:MAG: N-glycosylase/DNA lyase [Methanotrichaceae archaeon]
MDFGKKEDKGIPELMELYAPVKGRIESRLKEFKQIWETGSDEDLFRELVFCLLTPQSRAKTCWAAVECLVKKSLIDGCQPKLIQEALIGVRFNERKAEYICLARKMFSDQSLRSIISGFSSPYAAREWLVQNVMGLGYKEASHFLRNIGLGEDLAILDRHILKNLKLAGVIDEVPTSLSKKTYLDIEKKMIEFSKQVGMPMSHLDLLLWYKEAGDVFK